MHEIVIDRLGSQGDGIGLLDGKPVFIGGTVPGDRVIASGTPPHLKLNILLQPSQLRVQPLCIHFGTCGGCVFQHIDQKTMLEWKRAELSRFFLEEGIEIQVDEMTGTGPYLRRRVAFTVQRLNREIHIGFKRRSGTGLVGIRECPVLLPELANQIALLRDLSAPLLRGAEEIQIRATACDNGIDLAFDLGQYPNEEMLAAFVRAMARSSYLRASINGDMVVEKEKPVISFGSVTITPPCRGFLQAVRDAEQLMALQVLKHLRKCKNVVDLFCGSGTFALRLAHHTQVHAVEAEADPLDAIKSARSPDRLKPVTTEQRDLVNLPLITSELNKFDGLCLDPPRSGAVEQIIQIAKSDIGQVAYVSCNPATLARDAAILIAGDYRLDRVVPIDQFVYSTHIEVVALFSKKREKAKRSIFR